MNDAASHIPEHPELQASQRLAKDLARLYRPPVSVPEDVDRAVGLLARRHFAAGGHVHGVVRWLSVGAAAAAALLVIFWTATMHEESPSEANVAAAETDVDGSGSVDILDAFALARTLNAAQPVRTEWDITGDGIVNRNDVDAVAVAAVRLREERLQ